MSMASVVAAMLPGKPSSPAQQALAMTGLETVAGISRRVDGGQGDVGRHDADRRQRRCLARKGTSSTRFSRGRSASSRGMPARSRRRVLAVAGKVFEGDEDGMSRVAFGPSDVGLDAPGHQMDFAVGSDVDDRILRIVVDIGIGGVDPVDPSAAASWAVARPEFAGELRAAGGGRKAMAWGLDGPGRCAWRRRVRSRRRSAAESARASASG
jgi:hypothetical protein